MTRGDAAVAVDEADVRACAAIPAALLATKRRANAMGAGEDVLEAEAGAATAAAAAAPTRCCCCGKGVELLRIRRRRERERERI